VDIAELKSKSIAELHEMAEELNISNYSGLRKQDLIFRIEQNLLDSEVVLRGEGVLEILPEGYGFLRSQDWNYLYGPDDIYVSPSQIKRFDLRTGDTVLGQVRPPKEGERYLALLKVRTSTATSRRRPSTASRSTTCGRATRSSGFGWRRPPGDLSMRVMDLMRRSARGSAGSSSRRPRRARRSSCRRSPTPSSRTTRRCT
jgi:transcription termination factor Rho